MLWLCIKIHYLLDTTTTATTTRKYEGDKNNIGTMSTQAMPETQHLLHAHPFSSSRGTAEKSLFTMDKRQSLINKKKEPSPSIFQHNIYSINHYIDHSTVRLSDRNSSLY